MPLKDPIKRKQYKKDHYRKHRKEHNQQNQKNRNELRAWFRDFKSQHKCNMCTETHPACLDFHHQNPNNKKQTVANLVHRGASKDRIEREMLKCVILCANCHRKLHWVQRVKFLHKK